MLNIRARYKIDKSAYAEGKKVFEASTRLLLVKIYVLNASTIAKLANLLDFNRKRLKKMSKPGERTQLGQHIAEIEQQLAEFEQSHQDRVKLTAALQHNLDIVAKRFE